MTTTTEPTRAEVEAARKAERLGRLSMEHDVAVEETVAALRALDAAYKDPARNADDPLARMCAQGWVEVAQGRVTAADMGERAAAWAFDREQYGSRHTGSPGWVGRGEEREIETVQDGRVIAQRAVTVCRTPDCYVETDGGKWCAEHEERLARIRAEFWGKTTKRSKQAVPSGVDGAEQLPPKTNVVPKITCRLEGCENAAKAEGATCYHHRNVDEAVTVAPARVTERAEDATCGYGCGRVPKENRPACDACRRFGRMIPRCAVETCSNASNGETEWCAWHAKTSGQPSRRPCSGGCGRITGGRAGLCKACARAAKAQPALTTTP